MNKTSIIIVSTLTACLFGCSSSSNNGATSGTTSGTATGTTSGSTSGTATGTTSGSTSGSTSGTATGATSGTTDGADTGGTSGGEVGANPGAVPSPILAEPTTLNIASADALRGHKIFSGGEIRVPIPGLEDAVEFSHINFDFPCSGPGIFETWPAPRFASIWSPASGNFTWGSVDASDDDDTLRLDATEILTGDPDNGILTNGVRIAPIVNGDLIVDVSVSEFLVVARIVQYDECN